MTDHPRHHHGAAFGTFDPFSVMDGGLVQDYAPVGAPSALAPGWTTAPPGLDLAAPAQTVSATTAPGGGDTTTATATNSTAPIFAPATPAPVTAPAASAGGGLVINVNYDASVSTATAAQLAGLTSAVNTAVAFMESMFTTHITLTINVGWGEVGGTAITGANAVAASSSFGNALSYASVRSGLTSTYAAGGTTYRTQAGAALPGSDPSASTQTNDYYVSQAQEKALGITLFGGGNATDGSIGLAALSNWNFGTTSRAVAGQYDAVGAIEHEISEVMGRTSSLGTLFGNGIYTPLDLFRYAGVNALTPSSGPGSFSTNGQSLALPFNDPFTTTGDAGDWSATVSGDAFGPSTAGNAQLVSPTDLQVMNVLGWNLSSAGLTAAAQCFAAGTAIATATGAAPVEALALGDLIRTRFGGLAKLRWIGQRRLDCRRTPDSTPIRIAPHAFGPGAPTRPLWLSPEHAVAVEGALTPIRLLVNGGTIAYDRAIRRVTYFHLGFDRHDIVLAEGLPTESFLDAGGASFFHPRRLARADTHARRAAFSCLPLRDRPAALAPLWARLAARSAVLGWPVPTPPVTQTPDLALRAGRRRLAPLALGADGAVFALPADAPAWLVSRSMVPAALAAWREDRRRLGVRVRELRWRHGARAETIAADDPRLTHGWWAPETEHGTPWRWTDGAGQLPFAGGVLEVAFAPAPAYPLA